MIDDLKYKHSNYLFYVPVVYHHCTLDNFDFSEQKKSLVSDLKNFIEGKANEPGLYLWGEFGVGKTHLLVSLYRIIISKEDDVTDVFFSSFENLLKLVEEGKEFLDFVSKIRWLFLDDVSAVTLEEVGLPIEILRKIIVSRFEQKLPTCISGNLSIVKLTDTLHPHATSRLEGMCKVTHIVGKDRRRMKKLI